MFGRARARASGVAVACGLGLALITGVLPDAASATPAGAASARSSAPRYEGGGDSGTAASEADALAQAKRSGKNVEVASQRGESWDVVAKPDGTLETREYLRPVRARVGGEWRPTDVALERTPEGSVSPHVATVGVSFSGGGDTSLVKLDKAGRKLALDWPTRLPTPRLEGDTATYPDVLPDVDLRLTAQVDGFTQLLVVKSAKAAASPELAHLRLKMAGEGVTVQETAQGGLNAIDQGAGGTVFEAPTPMMWDSSPGSSAPNRSGAALRRPDPRKVPSATANRREVSGPAESGQLARVAVDVPDGGRELVLTPDKKVLTGPDTVYPVYIDPQWYSPRSSAWTMASKYWANEPQWKFNGKSDAGMGYCDWNHCNPGDTKRLFYEIPTSRFAGKTILSAEFVVPETWAASCAKKGVQLWRTKGIDSSTTWNSQDSSDFWIKKLGEYDFAYGFEGCASADAEFKVLDTVKEAAGKSWSSVTFGLRASDESDTYAWKRFANRAYLRVQYNQTPPQIAMSQLSMEYGGKCRIPEKAVHVRSLGKIYANHVTDPDGDDVAVEFQAEWDAGDGKGTVARWKPGLTSFKKSGSDFAVTLPSDITVNTPVNWYVRSYDRRGYSPWSYAGSPSGCYFVRDPKVLPAPRMASADYPESKPGSSGDGDPWYDGTGRYGSFTVGPAGKDITKYIYGINGDATPKNTLGTTEGAARTIKALPGDAGLNFITVQALDAVGNVSEPYTYRYKVRAGQPERATWAMDEGPDAKQAEGSTPARTAELHGGAVTGADGAMGKSLSLNGTDAYAETDVPVVDTSGGFTVSAWANLSKVPSEPAAVATQPGNHSPGFSLYYSKDYDRWAFSQFASDTDGALPVRVMQQKPGGVKPGEWTHLVGVYDSGDDELRLFVNGRQEAAVSYKTPWDARRGLLIGASSSNGKPNAFFPGQLDELEIFNKPASADEVSRLYAKEHIRGPGRPARAIFPLDEEPGAKEVTGHADVMPAVFHGNPQPGTDGVDGKALSLDGVHDYATVDAPHFNTMGAFAVSAWVRLPKEKPTHTAVVVTQTGVHASGVELYYSPTYDKWVLNQHTQDTADATSNKVVQSAGARPQGGEWTHLTGVRDIVAGTLTLYVNGVEAGTEPLAASWYADRQLQIGAGAYSGKQDNFFPGEIDELRIYDRPVSVHEVRQLVKQRPLVKGRWQFEAASGSPAVSPDALPDRRAARHDMTFTGGAAIGEGHVDKGGLKLNGMNAAAFTNGVPVDTSGSFTMTAWAQRVADKPGRAMTVMSAEGASQNAFAVRYLPGDKSSGEGHGRWQVTLPGKDAEKDVTVTTVDHNAYQDAGDWNHLALVYDGFSDELRLYVNGVLEEFSCPADSDAAKAAGCADRSSRVGNAVSFGATKALHMGRAMVKGSGTEYWSGQIDDAWAFQGALSDVQVKQLAVGERDLPTRIPHD
ncbi:LamG domain-containing protein [Streptomyces mobaraensis NBRC 13819 = DSM 40847]|uniref:LamG-like jellyroll fold domain-containing protein n=1 Tax=Streptomyces mobaraensis TaxID=35621 RepID=UPI000684797F|nr:LamG-like jellyroll fold domain-containing protein [Streptomyces mobaraensis]QTT72402.1 LamG domain-containing protein [Streptomyces mobaraensis NBRC 13819 = DSM 40847]